MFERALKPCTALLLSTLIGCAAGSNVQAVGKPAPRKTAPAAHAGSRPAAAPKSGAPASSNLSAAYNAYLGRLRDKLERHWYLADGKNSVELSVRVAPDGSVTELSMKSTPTSTGAEQAANDAFNQSQPLEALPANSPPIRLTLNFESSADPHGDSSRNISSHITPIKENAGKQESTEAPAGGGSN